MAKDTSNFGCLLVAGIFIFAGYSLYNMEGTLVKIAIVIVILAFLAILG